MGSRSEYPELLWIARLSEVDAMPDHQRMTHGARVRDERRAKGWDKTEMAQQLGAALSGSRPSLETLISYIKRWERGDGGISERYQLAYAKALSIPPDELFSDGDGQEEAGDTEVNRRALLSLIGAAAAAPVVQKAEGLRAGFNEQINGPPSGRDADAWERTAFDYAREVGALPANALLPELLCDFTELSSLITTAKDPVRGHLIHSAAQLATLTAITLTNLGDTHGARRWWRTAGRAADESGDLWAAALTRGRESVFSLYDTRSPMSVISVADQAIGIGRGLPSAGVASGYAAKAQALALLGCHEEAGDALTDLTALFDRLPDEVREDRSSQWGWSAQRLHHVESHVHTYAGDVERATVAQDAALATYPARNYQGRAQIELHRAGCLIQAGDVDEGARHAVRVLEMLPAELQADGLLRRTALTTLAMGSPAAAQRPAVRDAYELLAITSGDQ